MLAKHDQSYSTIGVREVEEEKKAYTRLDIPQPDDRGTLYGQSTSERQRNQCRLQPDNENNRRDGNSGTTESTPAEKRTWRKNVAADSQLYHSAALASTAGRRTQQSPASSGIHKLELSLNPGPAKPRPSSANISNTVVTKINREIDATTVRKPPRPYSAKDSSISREKEARTPYPVNSLRKQRPASSKYEHTANDGYRRATSGADHVTYSCWSRPTSSIRSSSRPVSSRTGVPKPFPSLRAVAGTIEIIRHWRKQKYRNRKRVRELSEHGHSVSNDGHKQVRRSRHAFADQVQEAMEREAEAAKLRKTRTFWWYCKVIKAVVKLALDMQKLSMQKTEQTPISEMYYINVAGPSIQKDDSDDSQILFFDKSWFSRKRATSRVPEWAQATTLKSPEERTEEEIRHLHNLLLNMRSFKEKFTEEMRLKICQAIRYTKCDKGRVILRQGHLGLDFYFIFSGSVFIQIDIEDKATGTISTSTENVIRHGESFGEIALLGVDGKRSACVICREPTELFTLDKATFLEVCPGIFEKELEEKTIFARQFPLFENWEAEAVKQLCFNSQVLYIPHGRTVDIDWSKSNFVYFVMKGRISLLHEFDANDMYNMTALGMMDKEIHFRFTDGDNNRHRRQIACIGWLHVGDASELRILSLEPSSDIASVTMLSEGVKVFRVAVRTFKRLAPRRIVEEYLKKVYAPREIPSNAEICEKVFKDHIWAEYKRKVLTETVMRQRHLNICQVPATSKGSSGWARWPGYDEHAHIKAGRLTNRNVRSEIGVFEFINVSTERGKYVTPADSKKTKRREDTGTRPVYKRPPETKPKPPEPVVLTNERSMISRPHPVRNIFELRANVNRIRKKIELNESKHRQLDSGASTSTKSVFLTAPNHE